MRAEYPARNMVSIGPRLFRHGNSGIFWPLTALDRVMISANPVNLTRTDREIGTHFRHNRYQVPLGEPRKLYGDITKVRMSSREFS